MEAVDSLALIKALLRGSSLLCASEPGRGALCETGAGVRRLRPHVHKEPQIWSFVFSANEIMNQTKVVLTGGKEDNVQSVGCPSRVAMSLPETGLQI